VKVDTTGLEKMLKGIQRKDMPKAVRNTLRDIMKDTRKREVVEMQRVFDRPTPVVKKSLRFTKLPEVEDLSGELGFTDVLGPQGQMIINTLSPHVPGLQNTRNRKGMEVALTARGLMRADQYLVPSRTMNLNRYGNVPGGTASKMLNDIGVFAGRSGFSSTTKATKVKYIWNEVRTRGGGTVKGIWLKSKVTKKSTLKLQMLVVDAKPRYAKRFRFHQVAESWSKKVASVFARKSVNHYITKKYGR